MTRWEGTQRDSTLLARHDRDFPLTPQEHHVHSCSKIEESISASLCSSSTTNRMVALATVVTRSTFTVFFCLLPHCTRRELFSSPWDRVAQQQEHVRSINTVRVGERARAPFNIFHASLAWLLKFVLLHMGQRSRA
jgi:hypothetical protein